MIYGVSCGVYVKKWLFYLRGIKKYYYINNFINSIYVICVGIS